MNADQDKLTPDEAATVLQIISQAGPSIRLDVSNLDNSQAELDRFRLLIQKLNRIAGGNNNGENNPTR
jgi:hypothetical protein